MQATAEIIQMAALSSDAVAGPLPASAAAHRRHASVLQLRGQLQQLADALALVTLADELFAGKAARTLSTPERCIVLAVGEQVWWPGRRSPSDMAAAQSLHGWAPG